MKILTTLPPRAESGEARRRSHISRSCIAARTDACNRQGSAPNRISISHKEKEASANTFSDVGYSSASHVNGPPEEMKITFLVLWLTAFSRRIQESPQVDVRVKKRIRNRCGNTDLGCMIDSGLQAFPASKISRISGEPNVHLVKSRPWVQVRLLACKKVVHDHDVMTFPDVPIHHIGTDEPCPTVTRILMRASAFRKKQTCVLPFSTDPSQGIPALVVHLDVVMGLLFVIYFIFLCLFKSNRFGKNRKRLFLSFPRRRESSLFKGASGLRLRGSDEPSEV